MRGQRLFIRPLEGGDAEAIREFFAANARADDAPSLGLIGKLVGDLVAVLAMEITADAVLINDLFVGRELRRKRIGRFMVDELARLARKIDRHRIEVDAPPEALDFFRRLGFEHDGLRMVKWIT